MYEALLTGALDKRVTDLVVAAVMPGIRVLADAEPTDRLSRHAPPKAVSLNWVIRRTYPLGEEARSKG
jgi:hypothetical protein